MNVGVNARNNCLGQSTEKKSFEAQAIKPRKLAPFGFKKEWISVVWSKTSS